MVLVHHVSLNFDGRPNSILLVLVTHHHPRHIFIPVVSNQSQLASEVLNVVNFGGV